MASDWESLAARALGGFRKGVLLELQKVQVLEGAGSLISDMTWPIPSAGTALGANIIL